MKLIDKDKVVAEIERRKEFYETIQKLHPVYENNIKECDDFLSFLDTLKVKEVNLEKSISDWLLEGLPNDEEEIDYIKETAEHFFELGLNAQKGE